MASQETKRTTSLQSFITFTVHFWQYCYVVRGVLGAQLLLVLLAGIGFARSEGIAISQGIYFAMITATTVGYGDITAKTVLGQCFSVFLALVGTITIGLVVTLATQAFKITIHEYGLDVDQSKSD